MELTQLNKLADKQKWLNRFRTHYSGDMSGKLSLAVFDDDRCKFFVAKENGKEMGFIKINNYTEWLSNYTEKEFWSASEAYVKSCYRSQGVLRFMISECVARHNVGVIRIETERLKRHKYYYKQLGFNYGYQIQDGYLSLLFHVSCERAVQQLNIDCVAANNSSFTVAA